MIAGRRNQLGLRALLMCSLALLLSPALAWGSPALAAGVPASAKYPAGCLASPFDASLVRLPPSLTVGVPAVLPPAVDLSASLPPIGDQQYTNSCTGWASTYYAKTMMEKKEHPSWDVTDPMYQFSPSWTYNQVNDCGNDTGAFLTDVMKLLAQRGAVDIQEMPFTKDNTATQPIRKQLQAALPYRNSGFGAFWLHSPATDPTPYTTPNPIEKMKAWLAAGNPVVIAIPLVDGIPASDGRDAPLHYFDYEGDGMAFGHAMCVVGYDDNANPAGADADHRGGFKIVSSFGADWNGPDKGFIYFSYDFMKRYVWEAWYMEDAAPDAPVLDSISASRSNVFGAVTLRGGNFGAYRRAARVSFNGVDSPFMAYSNGQVTALVPEGATSGPLTLYDWEGTATASLPFVVGGIEPTGALVNSATPGTCTTGNTVTVTAEGAGFAADSQLYLMGVSENRIPADSQVVTGSSAIRGVFDLDGALPGTYLVTVSTVGGEMGACATPLMVRDGVDTLEPNDSRKTAHGPVKSGESHSSYISTIGDHDYFKVTAPKHSRTLTATLSGVPDYCSYDLALYDSSGKQLAYRVNKEQKDETITLAHPRAAVYYVLVKQARNCDRYRPYTLKVTID